MRGAPTIVATLIVLMIGFLTATETLVTPWAVAGRSMEPALFDGDRVLVDRWTYRRRAARAGEVVLLTGPGGRPLVKRVSADAPAAPAADELWVVGDNPAASVDSRQFGAVSRGRLRGRVVFRYWPPSRVGPVRRGSPAPPGR